MLGKLNLVTVLAALVLFLFPWLDVRCSGETMVTQSGIQSIYGGATGYYTEGERSIEDNSNPSSEQVDEWATPAILIALAFAAIVVAGFFAIRALRKDPAASFQTGAWCSLALMLLIIQAAMKFPAEKAFLAEAAGDPTATDTFSGIVDHMRAAAVKDVKFHYTPAFYLELAALCIPAFIFVNILLDRFRKSGGV